MSTHAKTRNRGPMSARREWWVIGLFLAAGVLLQLLVISAAG